MPERIAKTRAFEIMGRAGWSVKALLFGMMGFLAIRVLFGERDEDADLQGAITSLAEQPGGMIGLWLVVVGLTGYGLWRVAVAVFDTENDGGGLRGTTRRLSFAAIGVFYGFIAVWLATRLIAGDRPEDNEEAAVWAARILELPAGAWMLGAGAAAVMVAGLYQVYRAIRAPDHDHMAEEDMSFVSRHFGRRLGQAAIAARGVAFGAIGFFLGRAALAKDPDEARDLGETVATLASQPVLLVIIAFGFIGYALHCLMNARFRTIGPSEKKDEREKRNGLDVGY